MASSSSDEDGFPQYENADVQIMLSPIRVLRLHSDVLKGTSSVFKQLLTNENAAVLSNKTKAAGFRLRHHIELVGATPELIGRLRAIRLDTKGRTIDDGGPRANMALDGNGRDPSCHILDDWYNVMAAIYGQKIEIGSAEDGLFSLLKRTDNIIGICSHLKLKKSIVFSPVEVALLNTNQYLWDAIQGAPIEWLDVAVSLQSVPMFRETVIHLVGQWDRLSSNDKNTLPRKVYELCHRKAEKFKQHKKTIENKILEYRPKEISYTKGEDPALGKRNLQPKIFNWIAFSGLQLWLMKAFRDGKGVDGPDGGFDLFSRLFAGHEEYYDREDQTRYVGVSQSGRAVVTQWIDDMKKDLKKMVASTMTSSLRMDTRSNKIDYFSCFEVELRHCPWVEEDAGPQYDDDVDLGDLEEDMSDDEMFDED
ncbi:hypothetical protein IWZ01DRAFT_544576 [Phyllosticta capitalensis]